MSPQSGPQARQAPAGSRGAFGGQGLEDTVEKGVFIHHGFGSQHQTSDEYSLNDKLFKTGNPLFDVVKGSPNTL